MFTCDRKFYFKRTKLSDVEERLITTTSSVSKNIAELNMKVLLNKAEEANNPSIVLGEDIKSVSSLWL